MQLLPHPCDFFEYSYLNPPGTILPSLAFVLLASACFWFWVGAICILVGSFPTEKVSGEQKVESILRAGPGRGQGTSSKRGRKGLSPPFRATASSGGSPGGGSAPQAGARVPCEHGTQRKVSSRPCFLVIDLVP